MIKFKPSTGTTEVYLEDVLIGHICKRHRLTPIQFCIVPKSKAYELKPEDLRKIADRIDRERNNSD